MRIVKRDGNECVFDISKIVDAICKASIRQEAERVKKEIDAIDFLTDCFFADVDECSEEYDHYLHMLASALNDEFDPTDLALYYQLQLQRERLEERRRELRALHKMKAARVSEMIGVAWMNRNYAAGRSNTSAVADPMLLSIPTPPTSEAANCSLSCGGMVLAYI